MVIEKRKMERKHNISMRQKEKELNEGEKCRDDELFVCEYNNWLWKETDN